MSCHWMTMWMVVVLFVVATFVPTVYSVRCYQINQANACTGDLCFKAECDNGGRVSGCFTGLTSVGPLQMENSCRNGGVGPHTPGTLKFCNCDNCNHVDNFRCEGTGRAGSGWGGSGGSGSGWGGSGGRGSGWGGSGGGAIHCYNGGNMAPTACEEKCFDAKCSNGMHGVKGCSDGYSTKNELVNGVEDTCRQIGSSYQATSLKYCNCDRCNGDVFKCETSSSAPTDTAAEDTTTTTTSIAIASTNSKTPITATATTTMGMKKTKIPGRPTQWRFGTRTGKLMAIMDKITPFPPGTYAKISDDKMSDQK